MNHINRLEISAVYMILNRFNVIVSIFLIKQRAVIHVFVYLALLNMKMYS